MGKSNGPWYKRWWAIIFFAIILLILFLLILVVVEPDKESGSSGQGGIETGLYGQITDSEGSPLAGASVSMTGTGPLENYRATTNLNGSYTLVNVSTGVYTILVEVEGYAKNSYPNFNFTHGLPYKWDVSLTPIPKKRVNGESCDNFYDCVYGSACKNNLCMTPKSVHQFDDPQANEKTVKVYAFYLVPNDRQAREDWQSKITPLINRSVAAYNRDLNGVSTADYEIYPIPVIGEKTVEGYRVGATYDNRQGFYAAMCSEVFKLKPQSTSYYTAYVVYPDFGIFDNNNSTDTGICDARLRCAEGIDMSDREMCDGSSGTAWGNFYGGGYFGCGIITQEAWIHPEISGASTVTAHEGLGHVLGLPHDDAVVGQNTDDGIMGFGYYYCYSAEESHFHPKLLERMIN